LLKNQKSYPLIIGHRGAKGFALENTLSSIRLAKNLGASWVEFDVKISNKEEQMFLFHDETLDRLTAKKGPVKELNFSELAKLSLIKGDFGDSQNSIPSFEDTVLTLKELNLGANIELKPCEGHEKLLAVTMAKWLQNHWPKSLPTPLVSSFSMETLEHFRNCASNIPVGLLYEELPKHWKQDFTALKAHTLHLNEEFLTRDHMNEIEEFKKNIPVLCYTVNSLKTMSHLFSLGVQSVFTDFPFQAESFQTKS